MLDRFQELADPYAQWVLANRNLVIIVLAFTLLIESLGLMIARWRLEKVSADLAEARQAPPPPARPTYAMPRPPAAPADLPPVRGGMTYARNLGGALDRVYGSPPPGPPPSPPPPPASPPAPPPYREQRPSLAWPEPPGNPYAPGPPPGPAPLAPPVPFPPPGPPPVYPPVVLTPPPAPAPQPPSFGAGATYYPPPAAPRPLAPAAPAPAAAAAPVAPSASPPTVPPIVSAEPAALPAEAAVPAAERLKRWVPKLRSRLRSPATPPPEAPQPVAAAPVPAGPVAPPPVAASAPTPPPAPVSAPTEDAGGPQRVDEVAPPAPSKGASSAVAGTEAPRAVQREFPAAVAEPAVQAAEEPAPPAALAPEPAVAIDSIELEEEQASPPAEKEADSTGAQTVLLIEDDESVARYYSMLFEARGYKVSIATDGVQGVDMATRIRPGLILLDVMMPRQNGMMVLQTLCATPATEDTPIVILSNFTEPTLIQRALQLGAIEYVVKTQVKAEALANAVPKWMQRERAFA